MQCVVKKRRLEPQPEPWSHSAKRVCTEAEVRSAECPMDTSPPFPGSGRQDQQQVMELTGRSCPRVDDITARLEGTTSLLTSRTQTGASSPAQTSTLLSQMSWRRTRPH